MKVSTILFFAVLFTISTPLCSLSSAGQAAFAKPKPKAPYSDTIGWKLCQDKENFDCVIVKEKIAEEKIMTKRGAKIIKRSTPETWEDLFPDAKMRELVQKLNRLNIALKKGMPIAVPKNPAEKILMDLSPFPKWIKAPEEKLMIFDPALLAWAAYKPNGQLAKWGPAIGGMDRCLDIGRRCRTVVGTWKIMRKGDEKSRSHVYPVGCGRKNKPCAPMPWFMQFERHGYGFHGSDRMVGKHASHGCVRLFTDDAKWLNQYFVEIGTKVTTRHYPNKPK